MVRAIVLLLSLLSTSTSIASVMFVEIDATTSKSSYLSINIEFTGLATTDRLVFADGSKQYQYKNLVLKSAQGKLDYGIEGKLIKLKAPISGRLLVSYDAIPGALGRHGLQGYADADFVTVDGRIFILPNDSADLEKITIRFKVAPHWQVHTAFRSIGHHYYRVIDLYGSKLTQLIQGAILLGPFETREVKVGNTRLTVLMYTHWPEAHRKQLFDKSVRIYRFFYDAFGFDPGRYFIGWTPKSKSGDKIYTTSWAYGSTMEMPTDTQRNYELLAHRIAHAINRYHPVGLVNNQREDDWFEEGWASYIEAIALQRAGITPDQAKFNQLYTYYINYRQRGYELDLPLADEAKANANTAEFLHYTKGPLIVKHLEVYFTQHSNRSLEYCIRDLYKKFGRYRESFALRVELERCGGVSLESFWDTWVRKSGVVFPVWTEYAQMPVGETRLVLEAGSVGVAQHYFEYLLNYQAQTFHDLEYIIRDETEQLKKYQALALPQQDLPPNLIKGYYQLPAAVRWLIHQAIKQRVQADPKKMELKLKSNSSIGNLYFRLLDAEKKYLQQKTKSAVRELQFRQNNGARLIVRNAAPVYIQVYWRHAEKDVRLDVEFNGKAIAKPEFLKLDQQRSYSYNKLMLPRFTSAGILSVRLYNTSKVLLERKVLYLP